MPFRFRGGLFCALEGEEMKLHNLAANLRKYGLTVVEIDGWRNRAFAGQDMTEIRGVLWHHTATPRSNFARSDVPTLGTCLNGNAFTPGPLCQLMLGRSGTVYVLAAGLCNHAGYGVAAGIPVDTGNRYFIGVEMESSGIAPADWTADQLRVAPFLGAALELEYLMHLEPEMRIQLGHREYTSARTPNLGGKIDPYNWPGGEDGLRAAINGRIAEFAGGTKAPTPAPAKPVPAGPSNGGAYVPDPHWLVEPGETMTAVANWAGFSVAEVAKFNGIKDPNVIHVGERIWSPAAGKDTWMVDPGDTLSGISAWYARNGHAVSVQQLQYANGINDPARETKVGVRLIIP